MIRISLAVLVSMLLSACGPKGIGSTVPAALADATASSATAGSPLAAYGMPPAIDPQARYLFYLHGKITEDQGLQAVSPEFGPYEYEAILKRLGSSGLTVISEQREKNADPSAWARRIQDEVEALRAAGVASEHITVVGASKGAYIAALASFLIRDPALNFVLLGTCYPDMPGEWRQRSMWLYGNVLAIYDAADIIYSGSCAELFQLSEGRGLGRHEELQLQVGTGHGILYQPLDEWVLPTLAWAGG
jgi:hypothetical protein